MMNENGNINNTTTKATEAILAKLVERGFHATVRPKAARASADVLSKLCANDRRFVESFAGFTGKISASDGITVRRSDLEDPKMTSAALRQVANLTLYGVAAKRRRLTVGQAKHPTRKTA